MSRLPFCKLLYIVARQKVLRGLIYNKKINTGTEMHFRSQPLLAVIAADPLPESEANMAVLARVPSGKGSAAFPGAADDR